MDSELSLSVQPTDHLGRRPDPFSAVWQGLRQPWLLIAAGTVALLLVVVRRFLPQMPGQYVGDPAAAARWLLATSVEYGALGETLREFGLFNVLHGFLLRFLIALVGLLLAIHLADLVDAALRLRGLEDSVDRPPDGVGEPFAVPGALPVHRLRRALPAPSDQMWTRLLAEWRSRYGEPRQAAVALAGEEENREENAEAGDAGAQERRLLTVRHAWAAYMRPLVLVGVLLTLAALWLGLTWGWEVTPPPLAPGSQFQHTPRNLTLHYRVSGMDPATGVAPVLAVEVNGVQGILAADRATYLRLDQVGVWVQPGPPGLLVVTADGREALTRPGHSSLATSLGLIFPVPGGEESLLLPEAGAGLRLVRLAGAETAFLVEVYHSDSTRPVQRLEIRQDQTVAIPLIHGELPLHFHLVPGLAVRVRHMPGDWLLWPALALMFAGGTGYLRRPFFVLAQLAPWPTGRSVLVVQSDTMAEVKAVDSWQGGAKQETEMQEGQGDG